MTIILNLGEIGQAKGPGMWKTNVSLLDDEEYLNHSSVYIPKWISEGERDFSDKRCISDWIEYNIRMHAIRYSIEKAKQRNDKKKMIQQEYEEATRRFENDPNDYKRSLLNEIKEKLEVLYEEKTNGSIVCARAHWQRSKVLLKYFLNLEKRNHVKKHIRKMVISGAITTDPRKILSKQKDFYCNLYKTRADSVKSLLNNFSIPQLFEEQKLSCEGQITMEECKTILNTFKIYTFYFNRKTRERSHTDRNWRLISLVNVDAKIISKVIASRIKNVLK